MSPAFLRALERHNWKGNIRELKNIIERSIILADDELTEALLPDGFSAEENQHAFDLASMERQHIARVLKHAQGNKTQAAKLLDIGLTTLYQKIKDYGL